MRDLEHLADKLISEALSTTSKSKAKVAFRAAERKLLREVAGLQVKGRAVTGERATELAQRAKEKIYRALALHALTEHPRRSDGTPPPTPNFSPTPGFPSLQPPPPRNAPTSIVPEVPTSLFPPFDKPSPARELLADANSRAQKWRYEFLKAQAIRASLDASAFESQILNLMNLAMSKVAVAEQILNPVLLDVENKLQRDVAAINDLGGDADLDKAIGSLADTLTGALLLELLLVWLVKNDAFSFWWGVFEAMVSDVASFDSHLPRVRDYVKKSILTVVDLDSIIKDARARLEAEVARITALLQQAVQNVVSGTDAAMHEVFSSFDLPLTQRAAATAGAVDQPDINPLAELEDKLENVAQRVIDKIRQLVLSALDPTGLLDKIVDIVMDFIVYPIFALFAISLVGGPFGAAALAAIVLISIEELAHLIIGWLTGPIVGQIDALKKKAFDALADVQRAFAQATSLTQAFDPVDSLRILRDELRQLKDFLPEVFLDEAAALFGQARDIVVRNAQKLALAAERALGLENATAFDAIAFRYVTNLGNGTQAPGGTDPALLAGAALLRDLGRLEELRTAMRDGKEHELVHRLSLVDLLGPTGFTQFLADGRIAIDLNERDLVDPRWPGYYRILISEVRIDAIASAVVPRTLSLPLVVTHLGDSRTRVRRDANPASPPLALPPCLPTDRKAFVTNLIGPQSMPQQDELGRAFDEALDLWTKRHPDLYIHDALTAIAEYLPESLAAACQRNACGCIDRDRLHATAAAIMAQIVANDAPMQDGWVALFLELLWEFAQAGDPTAQALVAALLPWGPRGIPLDDANKAKMKADVLLSLRDGLRITTTSVLPGLTSVTGALYDDAVADLDAKVSKWGNAYLESDLDADIGALGFATLVRTMPPESATFNLFSSAPLVTSPSDAMVAPASTDGQPLSRPQDLSYRPFENRGFTGTLLLTLPTVRPGTVGVNTALLSTILGTATSVTTAALTDLVVEIRTVGCYDEKLAAAVQTSRSRQVVAISRAMQVAAAALHPLTIAARSPLSSERRTLHFSLRAHRDKTLRAWTAAALGVTGITDWTKLATLGTLIFDGVSLDFGSALVDASYLASNAAFRFVRDYTQIRPGGQDLKVNLVLRKSPLASLAEMETNLVVTPDDLSLLAGSLLGDPAGKLVSVGIAAAPMRAGVDTVVGNPPLLTIGRSAQPAALDAMTNTFTAGHLLAITQPAAPGADPPSMSLDSIFNPTGAPFQLQLSLADAVFTGQQLYDIILSLTFEVPARTTQLPPLSI
ncbi:hypothetical protein [Burkholderia ubonensis]|uniref:hypothetical protein n=1 Tax=Burkholderia ubonensis TaxID=101571 RepID=UPI002ABDC9C8|nr:hypothetical protein [Burkholderia ubonensis]